MMTRLSLDKSVCRWHQHGSWNQPETPKYSVPSMEAIILRKNGVDELSCQWVIVAVTRERAGRDDCRFVTGERRSKMEKWQRVMLLRLIVRARTQIGLRAQAHVRTSERCETRYLQCVRYPWRDHCSARCFSRDECDHRNNVSTVLNQISPTRKCVTLANSLSPNINDLLRMST